MTVSDGRSCPRCILAAVGDLEFVEADADDAVRDLAESLPYVDLDA